MMIKELMEDLQLLREYGRQRSERAFTELVNRHIDFVYSTALRVVNETQLAQDVTQMVFIKLAQKAGSLREGTVVAGWLYRTTQFVAQTARRSECRRRKRESLAMQSIELDDSTESAWKEVAPLLEQAMARLRETEQDALLLRFFAGKSLGEVGHALGISDDAAQKRVNRALEKMRAWFASQGVACSLTVVTSAIAAHAVQAAPAGLAPNLITTAVAGTEASAGIATTLSFSKALALASFKANALKAVIAAIFLLAGAVVVLQVLPEKEAGAAGAGSAPRFVLRGTVRTADGKPLAGALVRVATPQSYVRLYQTTNSPARTNVASGVSNRLAKASAQPVSTNTAADGSFVIALPESPKDGMAAVVVNSDAGYALVTGDELSANPEVVVQKWARIEGVLRIGKSIGSNQTVNIGIWGATALYDWNLVSHAASVKTDAEGRFVFPRVAPVDVWLTHLVMVRSNDWRQSGHHYVKVLPGDQITVQLGGDGRRVTGRVSWESTNKLAFYGSMWASQRHGLRASPESKSMSREENRQYERMWRDSLEGEDFKSEVRNYEFPVRSDGEFCIEDVLPGDYRMQIRADELVPGGKGTRRAAVGEIQISVPKMSPGQSNEPIDIGELFPTFSKRP